MAEPAGPAAPGAGQEPALIELLDEQLDGVESALLALRDAPEAMVHDARVALRKLRSTLSLYASALDLEGARALRRELAWLAGELGPARDAQVLLDRIRGWVAEVTAEVSPVESDQLLAHFDRESGLAFTRARTALSSERFDALAHQLDGARLGSFVDRDAQLSVGLAARDLSRLLDDLEHAAGSSDEELHDLRKAVKRARYTRGRQDDVDLALKRVQAVLGEHQDSVVARQRLAELPASDLVARLLQEEQDTDRRSDERLAKAVRKLRKAAEQTPPYT